MGQQLKTVRDRFEREATAFDAIYRQDRGMFRTWFNRLFRRPIFERYQKAFEMIGNARGKTFLDVGCGSGIYSVDLALQGARYVLGVDFSSQMIQIARKRAKDNGVDGVCEFKEVNFFEMDSSSLFDFSIAMGVFDYLPDPVTFLQKMKSLTGGQAILSLPGNSLIRGPLRKLRYKFCAKGNVYYYCYEDIERIAKQAGYEHYRIDHLKTGSGFILVAGP